MKRFKLIIETPEGKMLSMQLFGKQGDAVRYYLNQLRYRMENPNILNPISGRVIDSWSGREVWKSTAGPSPFIGPRQIVGE